MRKILTSFFIVSLVLSTPRIICAEPSETIKYLMNEPASLFDLGLYRLNEILVEAPIPLPLTPSMNKPSMRKIFAEYHWESSRILINIEYQYPGERLPQNIKELITFDINSQKTFLGVLPSTGKPFLEQSRLLDYFSHLGYQRSTPKHLGKELDQATEFVVKVFNAYAPYDPKLIGRSLLLDTNIYWSEVETKTP